MKRGPYSYSQCFKTQLELDTIRVGFTSTRASCMVLTFCAPHLLLLLLIPNPSLFSNLHHFQPSNHMSLHPHSAKSQKRLELGLWHGDWVLVRREIGFDFRVRVSLGLRLRAAGGFGVRVCDGGLGLGLGFRSRRGMG